MSSLTHLQLHRWR